MNTKILLIGVFASLAIAMPAALLEEKRYTPCATDVSDS